MRVVITGAAGQLGRDLIRAFSEAGGFSVLPFSRQELDVSHLEAVTWTLKTHLPEVIVHAAAYTKVDQAEAEPEKAYQINGFGARNVAMAAESIGAKIVYVSTDFVFDGTKRELYTERDAPNPLGMYGRSKLLGESLVTASTGKHFIVRTAWLYGNYGDNFISKIIKKAQTQDQLEVIHDQWGSPTYTLDLARMIVQLIQTDHYGIYHGVNGGVCSRFEWAQAILEEAGIDPSKVVAVPAERYVTPAPRPAYSALGDDALVAAGIPRMRHWRDALREYIHQDYSKGGSSS